MKRPTLEVADIIRVAGDSFIERNGAHLAWPQLKVLRASELVPEDNTARDPGTAFLARTHQGETLLACACGQGAVALEMVQLEGKRALPAAEFLRGHATIVGARLGTPPS